MKYPLNLYCKLFLSVCIGINCYSQTIYTLNGTILDSSSGEPLIGASVVIPQAANGVVTNNYGYYSIDLSQGEYNIEVSYLGFEVLNQTITLNQNQRLNFKLIPQLKILDEVVLVSKNSPTNNVLSGFSNLKVADIQKIPVLFGEPDITRAVITQAGVNSVGDGASGFNVRGGNIDQNLILLDEAPVYNSSHLWGFFSTFNSDAIKNIKLYKGGIPARFGGRASSVLDIRQREGNNQKIEGQGGIGLLFSRLTLEGPIQKDKLSFLISGRRSYFDIFNLPAFEDSSVYFYDLSTKLSWIINEKNRLYASGYFGADVLRFEYENSNEHEESIKESIDFQWQNATATIRWNHLFNDKLFLNLSTIYSQYNYGLDSKNDSGGGPVNTTGSFEWTSIIDNYIIKPDFTYYQNNNAKWHFGLNATLYKFTPAQLKSYEEGINSTKFSIEKGLEIAPYIEYERKWNRISLLAGIRYSWFANLGPFTVKHYDPNLTKRVNTVTSEEKFDSGEITKSYYGVEPRLAISYQLKDRKSIKVGFDRNIQYIHLISNTTAALPFDTWKPAGEHVKPLDVFQWSLGYAYESPDQMWQTTTEIFYKTFDNIIEYKNGADLFLNDQIETQILPAKGDAYGFEGSLKKTKGLWKGEMNYTYSRAQRKSISQFNHENIRNGERFPSNYDRPHSLNFNINKALTEKWDANLFFTYQTGRPTTPAVGQFKLGGDWFLTYADRNSYRLPDLHRLDLSFNYNPNKKLQKKWKGSWTFGIYNVYGVKNVFSRFSNFYSDKLRSYEFSVIGAPIPFINYNFKF